MIDQAAIDAFAAFVSAERKAWLERTKQYRRPGDEEVKVQIGSRYVRLVVDSSAYCFVDMNTGDILKCAGWKSPAKGVRGNIAMSPAELRQRLSPYGVNYTGMSFLSA